MKVILNESDVRDLIEKSFEGVKKVEFKFSDKDFEVHLEVEKEKFSTISTKTGVIVDKTVNVLTVPQLKTVKKQMTSKEQDAALDRAERANLAQKRKKNVMVSRGEDRPLINVG